VVLVWGPGSAAGLRRPAVEQTRSNKTKAISFAAYAALIDLFPTQQQEPIARLP
jgi:hypothetical protein